MAELVTDPSLRGVASHGEARRRTDPLADRSATRSWACYEEHLELEKQLARYSTSTILTPEEDLERKRIQKLKLAGKDRIMEILGRYR